MPKKALIVRLGAYGDMIIISPVLTKLKEMGYHVTLNTSKRGITVYQKDPRVDAFIEHDETMPLDKVRDHWKKQKEDFKPDYYVNFSESLECNLALHPCNPAYIYGKLERHERCNHNYYDTTEKWAGLHNCEKRPSLHFDLEEHQNSREAMKPGCFNIVWCLSGSGKNKVYPWTDYVMGEILKNYKNVHIVTVGDLKCQLLESLVDQNITNLAGNIPMRVALCMTQYADLVVSPDTGILHASGCYRVPKIGLLGHTTIENITKYFLNDYSIEADCACAPCFRLIYDHDVQCPIECVTHAAWCMAVGITPEVLYDRVTKVVPTMYRRN